MVVEEVVQDEALAVEVALEAAVVVAAVPSVAAVIKGRQQKLWKPDKWHMNASPSLCANGRSKIKCPILIQVSIYKTKGKLGKSMRFWGKYRKCISQSKWMPGWLPKVFNQTI